MTTTSDPLFSNDKGDGSSSAVKAAAAAAAAATSRPVSRLPPAYREYSIPVSIDLICVESLCFSAGFEAECTVSSVCWRFWPIRSLFPSVDWQRDNTDKVWQEVQVSALSDGWDPVDEHLRV